MNHEIIGTSSKFGKTMIMKRRSNEYEKYFKDERCSSRRKEKTF
jgi:hypothetical protein